MDNNKKLIYLMFINDMKDKRNIKTDYYLFDHITYDNISRSYNCHLCNINLKSHNKIHQHRKTNEHKILLDEYINSKY